MNEKTYINIAQRLNSIYREYRYDNITSERAIKGITDVLDALNHVPETEYDNKYFAELIKKGIRYIIRIDASSKQVYRFLEECIVVGNLDLNARYELFTVLEQHFPKKVQGIRKYLLTHASKYFPDNIIYNDGFQGTNIIKAGLTEFLFRNHKILTSYGDFSFQYDQQCFSCKSCVIVNVKHDIFKSKKYIGRFLYAQRIDWKIEGFGSSYYFIDNNFKIEVKDLIFSVNIFKNYIRGFDEYKLNIQFSNSSLPRIQINYEDCDIRIYFFQ